MGDPEIRDDVATITGHRFLDALETRQHREVTIIQSLANLVLITPAMNPAVAGLARKFLARDTSTGGKQPEARTTPPGKTRHRHGVTCSRGTNNLRMTLPSMRRLLSLPNWRNDGNPAQADAIQHGPLLTLRPHGDWLALLSIGGDHWAVSHKPATTVANRDGQPGCPCIS
jgi:hypothetical protein